MTIPLPTSTAFTPNLVGVTSADFSGAVNDATAWLKARGGGRCYIPAGVWGVEAPTLLRPGVEIFGDWIGTTLSPANGYAGNVFENEPPAAGQNFARYLALSDIRVNGISRQATAIRLDHAAESFLDRVVIENCLIGIDADYSIITAVTRCKINSNRRGIMAKNGCNGFKVLSGTRVQASKLENIIIDGPNTFGCAIRDSAIESSGIESSSAGILIGGEIGGVKGCVVEGNHIEANRCVDKGQIAFGALSGSPTQSAGIIAHNWITGGPLGYRAIVVNQSHGIEINGNDTAGHQHCIWLESAAQGVKIIPGRADDTALLGGTGVPYFCADNGNIGLKGDVIMLANSTQRMRKPVGNIAVESPAGTVFVNGRPI